MPASPILYSVFKAGRIPPTRPGPLDAQLQHRGDGRLAGPVVAGGSHLFAGGQDGPHSLGGVMDPLTSSWSPRSAGR